MEHHHSRIDTNYQYLYIPYIYNWPKTSIIKSVAQEAVASHYEYIDRKTKNVISHLCSPEITYRNLHRDAP